MRFFFPLFFRIFTAKPQEEGKRVFSLFCPAALAIRMTDEQTLLVPTRKPFIRLTRFNFCFWSYNTTSTKHALRSCKLNSLFSKLNDFGFFSSPLLFKKQNWHPDRKSTRLNSSHVKRSRMPSSA